jgi:hypothetical protein
VKTALIQRKWRSRLRRTFFGLSSEYMEGVYEHFFFLKHFGGWSFTEAYNLPIGLREWFVNRLMQHMEAERSAASNSSGGKSKTLSAVNQPAPPPGMGIK